MDDNSRSRVAGHQERIRQHVVTTFASDQDIENGNACSCCSSNKLSSTCLSSTKTFGGSSGTEATKHLTLPSSSSSSKDNDNEHVVFNQQTKKNNTDVDTNGKLIFAVIGIYGAYLYYGCLQEDVFRFETSDGKRFRNAWFLQVFESFTNVIIGCIARIIFVVNNNNGQCTKGLSSSFLKYFFMSGASQVFSKGLTSLSLANGLSFPVATLAKSGKMAPVMMGQLVLGGTTYKVREYIQVLVIITGTLLLSLGKDNPISSNSNHHHHHNSTILGVVFILLSLIMDGITAGLQKRLKVNMEQIGYAQTTLYDFMFYSNISMMFVALIINALFASHDFVEGYHIVQHEPELRCLIVHFCICSAIGQSFIFYTVKHFDPLVCTTVTTTRKMISVLWSIFTKGHALLQYGWIGVILAIAGLVAEVQGKFLSSRRKRRQQH